MVDHTNGRVTKATSILTCHAEVTDTYHHGYTGAGDLNLGSRALIASAEPFLQSNPPPGLVACLELKSFLQSWNVNICEAAVFGSFSNPSVGWGGDSWNAADPPQTEVVGRGLDLLLLLVHHRKI